MYSELYLPPDKPQFKANGQFAKGHDTWNKGMKPKDWIDGRKYRRWKRKNIENLNKHRPSRIGVTPNNAKQIIRVDDDGNWKQYTHSVSASQDINGNSRNIRRCCQHNYERVGILIDNHKVYGYRWYYETDDT